MTEQEGYCSRFGKISVDCGYLTIEQLHLALAEQVDDNLSNRPHRVVGAICFDRGWMMPQQIEEVLNLMFRKQRGTDGEVSS